jgi:hypothetical protein
VIVSAVLLMSESGLSQIQHSLAKILSCAGFDVMVYESDDTSVLVIDAYRVVDNDKVRILVEESGSGVLMSDEANLPLQGWELVLMSLLSVSSEGERLALPWKDPLPRIANGSLDYGRIEFNEENIKRVVGELLSE